MTRTLSYVKIRIALLIAWFIGISGFILGILMKLGISGSPEALTWGLALAPLYGLYPTIFWIIHRLGLLEGKLPEDIRKVVREELERQRNLTKM